MAHSAGYAALLVVRQEDVPDPLAGSQAIVCSRCEAPCWVLPEARQVAIELVGSDLAICVPCKERELAGQP